jgi:hypothetical protein
MIDVLRRIAAADLVNDFYRSGNNPAFFSRLADPVPSAATPGKARFALIRAIRPT